MLLKQIRPLSSLLLRPYSSRATLSDFELQRYKTPPVRRCPVHPIPLYGGRHTVTMLPGTGIGPELMNYVIDVFKYANAPVDFEIVQTDTEDTDSDLENALMSIKRNGVAIKGNIEVGKVTSAVQLRNIAIRNELDMYAYILHCKTYPGVRAKVKNMDIVVFRQNTEGEYAMLEHQSVPGVVENLKIITRDNSERVARCAFRYARKHGRKKITSVHKANIMKLADGLFLQVSREVAKEFPEIEHNDLIVDNCCMQLVSNPAQFDMFLAPNLYGNILANVACGLSGGPGLWSGRNYGDHFAVFETGTRNFGRLIAGKNVANPVGMLMASVDMLLHLGHRECARSIKRAIVTTICEDRIHTPDLGGTATSVDVAQRIIDLIKGYSGPTTGFK